MILILKHTHALTVFFSTLLQGSASVHTNINYMTVKIITASIVEVYHFPLLLTHSASAMMDTIGISIVYQSVVFEDCQKVLDIILQSQKHIANALLYRAHLPNVKTVNKRMDIFGFTIQGNVSGVQMLLGLGEGKLQLFTVATVLININLTLFLSLVLNLFVILE